MFLDDIKEERRQKGLSLSNGKNWLLENRQIASEYQKVREYHQVSMVTRLFEYSSNGLESNKRLQNSIV